MNKFECVNFLWDIAESLRGTYKAEDYGKVMLPMIVLRRFDCLLDEYDREIIKKVHDEFDYINDPESRELLTLAELEEEHKMQGIKVYNTSDYNFKKLLSDNEAIISNFKTYINGFSHRVRGIIDHFKFNNEIDYLSKKNKLYAVIEKFSNVDLHIDQVDNETMGQVYEELIRRFYENTDAGEHYTPREVVELCMEMLFYTKEDFISEEGKVVDIADFCVGTGGMLSEARNYIEKNGTKETEIGLYGQELMDESFAICQADMIMKGEDPENIRLGNTLTEDRFKGEKFRFLVSNPPYGVTWKDEEKLVKAEAKLKKEGRFEAGTPKTSDGSLLFLQNMISKMKEDEDGSRIAIILNGSPLFTGDAGSGESDIRKWIIEKDLLEGIIALPTDMFYNTGISTYIWVLTNNKIPKRRGKIQLVDASNFFKPMRKSLGKKRKIITGTQIEEIKKIYERFENTEYSKVFDNVDFGFTKVTVNRPLKLRFEITEDTLKFFMETSQYKNLAVSKKKTKEIKEAEETIGREKQKRLIMMLKGIDNVYLNRDEFINEIKERSREESLDFVKGPMIKDICSSIGVRDEKADICTNSKGEWEADTSLKDAETIPLKEDIYKYFEREVKPHMPDAYVDESTFNNIGYEIPFTRHFYKYEKLRSFEKIMDEIKKLEEKIQVGIKEVLS